MDKLPDDSFSFVFVRQVYGFCEDWVRSHPRIDDVDLSYNIGLLAHITNPRRWYLRGPSPSEMDHITTMLASVIAPCFREKAKELWDKIDHAATIYAIYSMPGFKAINDGFIIEEGASSITPPPPPCSPSSSSSPALVPVHSTPLKASQVVGDNEETDEINDKEDPSIVVVVKRPRSPDFDKDDDDDDEVPPASEKQPIIADPDYEHDELADYLSDDDDQDDEQDDDDQDDNQDEQDTATNPPNAKKQKIVIWIQKLK